jgi:hypothetical protein
MIFSFTCATLADLHSMLPDSATARARRCELVRLVGAACHGLAGEAAVRVRGSRRQSGNPCGAALQPWHPGHPQNATPARWGGHLFGLRSWAGRRRQRWARSATARTRSANCARSACSGGDSDQTRNLDTVSRRSLTRCKDTSQARRTVSGLVVAGGGRGGGGGGAPPPPPTTGCLTPPGLHRRASGVGQVRACGLCRRPARGGCRRVGCRSRVPGRGDDQLYHVCWTTPLLMMNTSILPSPQERAG